MNMDGENRIVLNIGGIRFETYKTVGVQPCLCTTFPKNCSQNLRVFGGFLNADP